MLQQVMDLVKSGFFSPQDPGWFRPLWESLENGDRYLVMADFDSYVQCQEQVAKAYLDRKRWTQMSILNVAHMGVFSSDRTIRQYADEIWDVKGLPITLNR